MNCGRIRYNKKLAVQFGMTPLTVVDWGRRRACFKGEIMYAIEKELKILRQFISPKLMDGMKKWNCYSEDEISAAEKRLHVKLPIPIREIYRYMADLLVTSGYLRPLELLHCEGKYLGFFLSPGEDSMIGIQKGKTSGDLYMWEENDPKGTSWEYLDDLETACEEGDVDGKQKAVAAYQNYWKRRNIPFIHVPLNVHKLERGSRFNRRLAVQKNDMKVRGIDYGKK